MKNLLYIINIIIAILVFSSCKDENDDMPSGKDECYTLLVSVPDGADTRAYYKEDGGDISVMWEKGDVIKVGDADFVFKEMQNGKGLFYHYGAIPSADSWSGTISFNSDSNNQLQKKNNECREHLEANVTGINLNGSTTVELMPAEGKSLLHIQAKSPAMFLGKSTLNITGLTEEYTIQLGENPEYVFADEGDQLDIYVIVPAGEKIASGQELSFLFKTNDGSEEYCYSMMCNAPITAKNNEVVKMPLPTKPTRYLHIHGVAPVKILSGSMLKAKGLTANYDVSIQKDYAAGDPLDFYFALAKNDTIKNEMSLRFYLYAYDASTKKWETGDEYHYYEAQFEESQSNEVVIVDLGTPTHIAIQLGLPSGTKWATTNVGAEKETDYGDYFSFGEIEPKDSYTDKNSLTYNKNYQNLLSAGIVNLDSTLVAAYDVATQNWGDEWKMPSRAVFQELLDNIERPVTVIKQPNNSKLFVGYRMTSKINGKTVFFPTAGYINEKGPQTQGQMGHYRTSSLLSNPNNKVQAYKCHMQGENKSESINIIDYSDRYKGFSIRPVRASN